MANVVVAQRMWQRRGSAALWASRNPVLEAGEIGVELGATNADPQKFKIGNGATPWNDLAYAGGEGGGAGGPAPVVVLSGTSYTLADLTPGAWHRFTANSQVTITVQNEATFPPDENAEFGLGPRGTGAVSLVAATGVTIAPPLGGTLLVEAGGFSVLKKVAVDQYEVVGSTEAGVSASMVAYSGTSSGLSATNVQDAIDEIAEGGGGPAPVVVLPGSSYALTDLTPGAWHVFTSTVGVSLSVPPSAATQPHEFGLEARNAAVSLAAGSGVAAYPPKLGSLALGVGDFSVLKRTSLNTYKLIGSTENA